MHGGYHTKKVKMFIAADHRHPIIRELKADLDKGILTRREFLRFATLIGLSVTTAYQMSGLLWPRKAAAVTTQQGKIIRIATSIPKITHPARFSYLEPTNILRNVTEYLTITDRHNITHPYLLKNWRASEDLKTWTLNLRKGIKFNNGDPLTADDVMFSINQWLDKDQGSSLLRIMGKYLDSSGIEKIDKYQIKLHLKKPVITVPEHLFHYTAMILNHKTFEGDFIQAPHGTGPYKLEVYQCGDRALLKHRNGYWQKKPDGNFLAQAEAIEFVDLGTEIPSQMIARKVTKIDMIDVASESGNAVYKAIQDNPRLTVKPAETFQTRVLRMQVDSRPWNDKRVRTALRLCHYRKKILGLAHYSEWFSGHDLHICPTYPNDNKKPMPALEAQNARKLLIEAGYPIGLKVNLTLSSEWRELVRFAEVLKEDATPAGFNINIQTIPTQTFWEKWKEIDLSLLPWVHHPQRTLLADQAALNDTTIPSVAWIGVLMTVCHKI